MPGRDSSPCGGALTLGIGLDADLIPDGERCEHVVVRLECFGQWSNELFAKRIVEGEGTVDPIGNFVFTGCALHQSGSMLGKLFGPTSIAIGGTALEESEKTWHGLGRHTCDVGAEKFSETRHRQVGHVVQSTPVE